MPAPYSAGSIFLQVVPSFRGVPEAIEREAREWDFSTAEKSMEDSLRRGAKKGAQKAGKDAAEEFTTTFAKTTERETRADRLFKAYGTVSSKAGKDAGKNFSDGFSEGFERSTATKKLFESLETDSAKSAEKSGDTAGKKYSGKFRESLRRGLAAAQREADALEIKFKDGEARRQLTELQVGIKGLDRNIELGMSAGKAFIQMSLLEAKARDLQDRATDLEFRSNIGGVIKDIATMRAGIEALSNMSIEPEIKLDTDKNMGAFERGLKGAINNALRDLGTVDIGATSNSGQRAVADLRKQLFDLGDLRIGVDISAETAREKLLQIRDQLEQIQREHWSVELDANTAAAVANLIGFLSVLDEIDGHHVDVDVDVKDAVSATTLLEGLERHGLLASKSLDEVTGSTKRSSLAGQDGANSFRAFNARILGFTAIAPLAIPALGGIAAGIAALLPLAAVGGAALGVLALGLLNVGQALRAVSQFQAQSNQELQTYSKGVDTAAKQVRSANEGLANAQKDAAQASEDSARRVSDAERGVADARRESSRAAEDSARSIQQAERGVEDAERSLADAQQAAQQAQEDLTQARKDAQDQLDELQLRVRDGALDQRQAVLDLRDAESALAAARAQGKTGLDLEKYLIQVDRAKLRIDQTAESADQLRVEQEKWAKTGVEGSDAVAKAQDRVTSANQGVLDAQQRVTDSQDALVRARQDAAQQAQDSARRVSDAERSLSDARRDQARQQEDSQAAIAKAQESVNDALNGYSDALSKTNSAQDKLRQTMQALSPTGQRFVLFLMGLKEQMGLLSQTAEEGLLPGLSGWIDSIVNKRGPQLQGIVKGISGALGDMFAHFGGAIQGQAFGQLFDMMNRSGPRFVGYMGSVLSTLGEGVASLTAAMEPLGDLFGTWLIEASRKFRDWASSLSGSTGLQTFFQYIREVGPKIGDLLFNVGDALLAIGKAVAPSATKVIDFVSNLAHWISQLDPETLNFVAVNLIKVVLGMQAIFGITAGLKSLESAYRLVTGAMTEFTKVAPGVAGAVPKIGMFAGVLGALYTSSSTVRDAVNGAGEGIAKFVGAITGHLIDLKDFAQTLITIVAAWKGFSLLKDISAGPLANLGKVVSERVAPQLGVMAWNLTKSDEAGNRVTTTMGKVGGAIGKLGNALPIIGVGLGLVAAGMDIVNQHAEDQQNKLDGWVTGLHQGGEKAQEAAKKIADYKAEIEKNKKALEDNNGAVGRAMEGQEGYEQGLAIAEDRIKKQEAALRKSEKAYQDWYDTLTPIEQKQADLQEAQNNLTYAIEQHGTVSWQARDAAEKYGIAEGALKQIQYDVASATSGLNAELIDQLGLMQSLGDAELGYDQAVSGLVDAHQRSADALRDYGSESKEYKDALLAEERAERSTAEAAQRAMEIRYQNADAATRQAMGQAAYYLELERQKKLYGELPPRLEAYRLELEKSIDPAVLAAAKFQELGVNIQNVPDSKTIVLDSSTTDDAIQKMTDLGLHVERLPDGTVKVTADSAEAQAIIDEILKPKTVKISVEVQKAWDTAQNKSNDRQGFPMNKNTGGHIAGPGTGTSDDVPIWASNGEYIVRAASVRKYGLSFFDQINQGHYASGGLIVKQGRAGLGFAGGGEVNANWGGTISLSGGNLNPLAEMWYSALGQISSMSQQAAGLISGAFASMAQNAMGIFGQASGGILGQWLPFLGSLQGETGKAAGGMNGIFGTLRDSLFGRATETRDGTNSLFGQMRDWLLGRTDETRDGVNTRLGQLRDNSSSTIYDAVQKMFGHWGTLPSGLLGPVNTIIDKVLNNGLFKAFNAIVGALGLDAKLNIKAVDPAKLAAGGRVPGWSPHDKADNIPAMLTAGEYVHPVDSVRYYGPEFMEAIRKKKLPRNVVQHYATGGYVAMQNAVLQQFPWARITSTVRPGDPGYHGKGQAIDIGGSVAYPGGQSRQQMLAINRWIADTFKNITELIHTDTGAINLWHGQPHTYNAATQAEHRNHVHWAMAGGLDGSGGLLASLGKLFGVAVDAISDPVGFLKDTVEKSLDGFGGTPIKDIMAGGARKLTGFAVDKISSFMGSLFGSDDSSFANVATGPIQEQVQQVFANHGWTGGAWNDGAWVIGKESGWDPNAQNPSSTASGLGQFIDATWRAYRPAAAAQFSRMKFAPVPMQAEAIANYMKGRYGGPTQTRRFWEGHHYYSDGGPVQDIDSATGGIVPDLHDTGGWLMPGLNVIMNKTGRPEPTINPQTLDALQSIASQGRSGGGDTFHLPIMQGPNPREVAGEIMHAKTVAQRGGKY